MAYYCFLCNKNHEDTSTEEHFIPRSINGPEDQWLPVCKISNARSNSVFDNGVRDILYMARHQNTNILKRTGDALLTDGSLKQYKFSYDEPKALEGAAAFRYFYDRELSTKIESSTVYAIKFSVGLNQQEQLTFCRGLAKMSIGALAYLLLKQGVQTETVRHIYSQTSIDSIRHIALDLPWAGKSVAHRFSLGRTDVLSRLQATCKNPQISNHVIRITFEERKSIHIEGMLYSKYGWLLELSNDVIVEQNELRLENSIADIPAPAMLRDLTLSPDSICIINPNYKGEQPLLPKHWINERYDD